MSAKNRTYGRTLLTAVAALLLSLSAVYAQSAKALKALTGTTPMSQANIFDYGIAYGYGGDELANFGFGLIDLNFADYPIRLRAQGGLMEIMTRPCLCTGLDVQYLYRAWERLYIYPTAGFYGEYHDTATWTINETGERQKWGAGIQFGGGIEYQFSSYFGVFMEAREQVLANVPDRPELDLGFICHIGKGSRTKAAEASALADRLAAKAAAEKVLAEKALAERLASEKAEVERLAAEKAEAERREAEKAEKANDPSVRAAARVATEYVYFDPGKDNIIAYEASKVSHIIRVMNEYPEATVAVDGYADRKSDGTEGHLALSKRRASVIRKALVDSGIAAERITTAFQGDTDLPSHEIESSRVVILITK